MKRFISIVLLAVFLLGVGVNAFALHEGTGNPEAERVLDGAELLSDSREKSLEKKISRIGEKYGFDVLVITVATDVGDVMDYAEVIYDTHGYGYGENCDGILIVVSTFTRDCTLSATGRGEDVFTEYGLERIIDLIYRKFTAGDYEAGISKFVTLSEKFLAKAERGQPYDYNEKYYIPADYAFRILVGVFFGIIGGLVVLSVKRAGMKTAVRQKTASAYMVPGSMVMGTGRDVFITSVVTKTPKAQQSSQSGRGGSSGGSGGSHVSSAGRSHSSATRKF